MQKGADKKKKGSSSVGLVHKSSNLKRRGREKKTLVGEEMEEVVEDTFWKRRGLFFKKTL